MYGKVQYRVDLSFMIKKKKLKRKIKSETRQGPKERQGRFKGIILRKEGEKGN